MHYSLTDQDVEKLIKQIKKQGVVFTDIATSDTSDVWVRLSGNFVLWRRSSELQLLEVAEPKKKRDAVTDVVTVAILRMKKKHTDRLLAAIQEEVKIALPLGQELVQDILQGASSVPTSLYFD